jgi:peptide chain release factor subunit 1
MWMHLVLNAGKQEGSQFCRGFGGIGGILRYQLDMRTFDELSDDDGVYEDDF